MLFYQLIIIAFVVILIYILAYLLKKRHRNILVVSILVIITAGGIALYAIQYYFGNHYYTQEISTSTIEGIQITESQLKNFHKIFSDYKSIKDDEYMTDVFRKTYTINANGAKSVIEASIYIFSEKGDADKYFEANQKFFENKNYIPLDTQKSKRKGSGERYLVSLIKSQYKDYTDFFYSPSKITYLSDVTIVSNNVIITISETANKPVANKGIVIEEIKKKLAQN